MRQLFQVLGEPFDFLKDQTGEGKGMMSLRGMLQECISVSVMISNRGKSVSSSQFIFLENPSTLPMRIKQIWLTLAFNPGLCHSCWQCHTFLPYPHSSISETGIHTAFYGALTNQSVRYINNPLSYSSMLGVFWTKNPVKKRQSILILP